MDSNNNVEKANKTSRGCGHEVKCWIKKNKDNIISTSLLIAFFVLVAWLTCGMKQKMAFEVQAGIAALLLLIAAVGVIHPLIRKERTPWVFRFFIGVAFAFLVYASMEFCRALPEDLAPSIIQILITCGSGFFALYGIGLTMKFNRLQKEENEIENAKPIVFVAPNPKQSRMDKSVSDAENLKVRSDLSSIKPSNNAKTQYYFRRFSLSNSDLATCTIQGITINESLSIVFKHERLLQKSSTSFFGVDYIFTLDGNPDSIELIVGDRFGNLYSCPVSFEIEKAGKNNITASICIDGVYGLQPLNKKVAKCFIQRRTPPKTE